MCIEHNCPQELNRKEEIEVEKRRSRKRISFMLVNNVADSLILKQTDTICFSSVIVSNVMPRVVLYIKKK